MSNIVNKNSPDIFMFILVRDYVYFFLTLNLKKKILLNTQNKSILLITIKNKSVSYNLVKII